MSTECSQSELHTPCPKGYIDWHNWAELKSKTHKQIRCPGCGLLKIWVPKEKEDEQEDAEA